MISTFFVNRPIFSIVIAVVLTLVGIIALTTLPVSQYPDITPPVASVSAIFTGADAKTVEETVTTPIEVEVNGDAGDGLYHHLQHQQRQHVDEHHLRH